MKRIGMVAVVAALLAVGACGDSGGDGDGDGGGAADDTQIAVIGTEFVFTPDAYLVDAGAEVKVTLSNEGSIEHNWVLLSEEIRSEDDLDTGMYLAEAIAQPGESGEVTFTAPAAGTYQVVCDIPGHFAAGMEGELTVSG